MSESSLIVLAGPTASGKSALAMHLAELFCGEIVSCDSVAVYRGLDIGTAKPSTGDQASVPHHALDLYNPTEFCTAGDYARHARRAIASISSRNRLPIVSGGTGLYLRALLEGLAPAPPRDEALRERLRSRAERNGPAALHRLLRHFDSQAAGAIHPNDVPKLIRSLEVTLTARTPQTQQWSSGRDPLGGYRILAIGLDPPREELYTRINARAERMFERGLLHETQALLDRHSPHAETACACLRSLGYAQAVAVLRDEVTWSDAVAAAQQGHRNYAKRQLTWFRKQLRTLPQPAAAYWLEGFGDDPELQVHAEKLVREHMQNS